MTGNVLPLEATFQWGATTLVYNGSIQYPICTIKNLVAGDVVTLEFDGDYTVSESTGNYAIEVTGLQGDDKVVANYKLPSDDSVLKKSYTITPAKITSVDQPAPMEYTGETLTPELTVMAGETQLDPKDYQISWEDSEPKEASEYKGTVVPKGNNVTGSVDFTFTVTN